MNDLINNKNIVIVGPSPYLKDKEMGSYIDSFDTVIRINRGHSLTKDYNNYGSRTDILYHCISQNIENGGPITDEILTNVKLIVGAIPLIYPNENSSIRGGTVKDYNKLSKEAKEKLIEVNKKWYLDLEKRFDTRPNTGVTAIFDILENYNPEFIYITGFTMFKDGHNKDYRDIIGSKSVKDNKIALDRIIKAKNHNQYKIWRKLKDILYYDNIKLDDELLEILKFDIKKYKSDKDLGKYSNERVFYDFLKS